MDTFLAVCEYMNFTKAAQNLGLTQPAISQHIHFLEKEYGAKLFTMNGRKVQLTAAGRLLKNAALTIRHDEMHLKHKMHQTTDEEREYHFGATLTVADYIFGPGLIKFQKLHPQSHISLYVANTKELLEKIESGQLDFAIIEGYFPKEEYESYLYRNEPYIPVCAKNRSSAFQKKDMTELLNQTLIVREQGSGTRKILEKILEEHNFSLYDFKNLLEIGSLSVIKELVAADCGISFLYRAAAKKELEEGILETFLPSGWDYSHNMTFIFRKGSVFRDEYEKIFREIQRLG